jgi:hypothetical protein
LKTRRARGRIGFAIAIGRQARMFVEDLVRAGEIEAAKPMRRATSQRMSQSPRASPGAGRKARWREMRRSELVTVPSFSPQPSAGSSTWA